ncbi:MAG TPA: histidine--tRNA ligase [Ignavibacteriaceae bacterium]|nr:histidine--tRNA ligase [Ignavibacteriaceae bacterium]
MIKAITGTKDILPLDVRYWKYLESIVDNVFSKFNYKEIRTPIFEETVLFARGIGEETDIVSKEMYTFVDRGGTSLTLRPEGTAPVVRSFIENSLGRQKTLNKLYYMGAMFRQERPQAGRQRQFHQFGGEAMGSKSPLLDAEMIQIAYDILKSLGLKDLTVKINSLGEKESRENYKNLLREYLAPKKDRLSEDSRRRFDTNILRIFDSKIDVDQELLKDAPLLLNHIDDESKEYFEIVKNVLSKANIPYEVDPALVRGLDYYTRTTFEIISGKVGSQSALCGGGRYDLLIEELGGDPTPGVGFAAGIERILLACTNENSINLPDEAVDIYIVKVTKDINKEAFNIASDLRRKGLAVEMDYNDRSVKAQMREANKENAKYVMFLGGDEFAEDKTKLKNMQNGEENTIPLNELNKFLKI